MITKCAFDDGRLSLVDCSSARQSNEVDGSGCSDAEAPWALTSSNRETSANAQRHRFTQQIFQRPK